MDLRELEKLAKGHTEGPWVGNGRCEVISQLMRRTVCRVYPPGLSDAQDAPNAALIASAPDLLDTCLKLAKMLERLIDTTELHYDGSATLMAKYCANCERDLRFTADHCPHCGLAFTDPAGGENITAARALLSELNWEETP